MRERFIGFLHSSMLRYIATAAVVVLIAAAAVFAKSRFDNRTFSSYEVESSEAKADSVSRFAYVDGCAVRYSSDGASLLDKDLNNIWSVAYEMSDPRVDVCGGEVLIYDRGGNSMFLFNKKERVSSLSMEKPILLANISEKNTVAVILEDGEKAEFLYCTSEGTQIAAGETTMSDPGYPFAMAISPDGMNVAISYLTVQGGTTGTAVRFYNFGSAGKSSDNNMTGELVLSGSFAPDVQYLGDRCLVFRDDGFTVIRDPARQADNIEKTFDRDIVSVFNDRSHIGLVFRSMDKSHRFEAQVYGTSGEMISSFFIDHSYSALHVCDGQLIVCGGTDLSVFTLKGVCRFSQSLSEGTVADVLRIGRDRCLVLTDQTMEVIKFT